jgi:hypothetical protein
MPHWDSEGRQQWVCQKGAHICTGKPIWVEGVGNVCSKCHAGTKQPQSPISLTEYCRQESGGLSGQALTNYINRYYGHG